MEVEGSSVNVDTLRVEPPEIVEVPMTRHYIDGENPSKVFLSNPTSENVGESIRAMCQRCIGSNVQKADVINAAVVPRLLDVLETDEHLWADVFKLLASLCSGPPEYPQVVLHIATLRPFLRGVQSSCKETRRACYRCMRAFAEHCSKDEHLRYMLKDEADDDLMFLISKIRTDKNSRTTIPLLIATTMENNKLPNAQERFKATGLLEVLLEILKHDSEVNAEVLRCLSALLRGNPLDELNGATDSPPLKTIIDLMRLHREPAVRMQAATNMIELALNAQVDMHDPVIRLQTITTLVQLLHARYDAYVRICAARSLFRLIEDEDFLQKIAAQCHGSIQLIDSSFFTFKPTPEQSRNMDNRTMKKYSWELAESGYQLLAVFCCKEEELRKKVSLCEEAKKHICTQLSSGRVDNVVAALNLLLSLSRSVRMVRTTFEELKPACIMVRDLMLHTSDREVEISALSVATNLVLEFSVVRDVFETEEVFKYLGNVVLNHTSGEFKKVQALWCLANYSYSLGAEVRHKLANQAGLGWLQYRQLLNDSEESHEVAYHALSLLRNITQQSETQPALTNNDADQVIELIMPVLSSDAPPINQEMALFVLANIISSYHEKFDFIDKPLVVDAILFSLTSDHECIQASALHCIICLLDVAAEPNFWQKVESLNIVTMVRGLNVDPSKPSLYEKFRQVSRIIEQDQYNLGHD